MSKPWSDMTERERDHEIARLIGDEIKTAWSVLDDAPIGLRHYTTSLDAMQLVEGVIQERGLQRRYLEGLATLQERRSIACDLDCLAYEGETPHALWAFVCAPPAQRAEAAYRVLTGD